MKYLKLFGICLLISLPIMLGTAFYIVRLLSSELDTKFYASPDAMPTKVYSRVFWLRPGQLLSIEELRARLEARSYHSVKSEAEFVEAGSYQIFELESQEAENYLEIKIALNKFSYPSIVSDLLFDEFNVGESSGEVFSILWKAGRVEKVFLESEDGDVELEGLALEPEVVAQLNSGQKEARKTIPIHEIPYTLLQGIVIVEDKRFLEHKGVDPKGILRSIWVNIRAGYYKQGASTITQQLIRNIYLTRAKTIKRKLKEMAMAMLLEIRYSKDDILAKYLNEVYFGQLGSLEIHGVSEAAKHYFNKSIKDLSVAEQALLAGIVRGPFYYSPYRRFDRAKKRQELVLSLMLTEGVISKEVYEGAMAEEIVLSKNSKVIDRAPYFTDFIKAQMLRELPDEKWMGTGYKIFSTLDTYYQSIVEKNVKFGVEELEERIIQKVKLKKRQELKGLQALQGVFILLDPHSGQLLSIVGGRSFADSNYNRALLMSRQIGSIIKPFVYLSALMFGKDEKDSPYNSISKIEDEPFEYRFDNQLWKPKNYADEYQGLVTFRYALANSINVPAAKLGLEIGIDKVAEVFRVAGVKSDLPLLPSLSLGATEVVPIDIARAYTTLASYGMRRDITSILAITDETGAPLAHFVSREEQALPVPETANIINMLQSTFAEGTAKSARKLGFDYPAAGKTGTTNDYRDSWFIGFTPKILGLSWVGFDKDDKDIQKMRKKFRLTGASGALPIWTNIMKEVHKALPKQEFQAPEGALLKYRVDLISGGRATNACEGDNVVEEVFTERNKPQYSCE